MSIPLKQINKKNDNTTLKFDDEENLSFNGQSLLTEKLISDNVYPKTNSDNNHLKINLFLIGFKIICALSIIILIILFIISIYKINNIENKIENKIENTLFNFINKVNISSIGKLNNDFINYINKLVIHSQNNLSVSDNPIILNRVLNDNISDNILNYINTKNNNTNVEFWN